MDATHSGLQKHFLKQYWWTSLVHYTGLLTIDSNWFSICRRPERSAEKTLPFLQSCSMWGLIVEQRIQQWGLWWIWGQSNEWEDEKCWCFLACVRSPSFGTESMPNSLICVRGFISTRCLTFFKEGPWHFESVFILFLLWESIHWPLSFSAVSLWTRLFIPYSLSVHWESSDMWSTTSWEKDLSLYQQSVVHPCFPCDIILMNNGSDWQVQK